ncbi:MAG: PQQ-binding-like beta-propeller repeat protein, partial [Candidatus Hydrogenedentes bacterium]|nr:PQQ-binding-like beta-propeller repeat protein [Candidatus Hydrogenedentota bacterium]
MEPHLKWSFETQGKIYASPILADIDNDGKQEVIVCASRDRRILCLSCTGELLWDYRLDDMSGDGLQATPSALDFDGDGAKEVFFASKGGVVGCIDRFGILIWRAFVHDSIDYSGPLVADIDGDHHAEVVVGGDNGMLYCFDDCGQERWHYQGDGQVRGIPAFLLDARTRKRMLFATFGAGAETALDPAGKMLWSFNEPGPRKERRSTPALGLIDDDFDPDVVTVTEDFQVIVRDAISGAEKWRWAGKSSIDQTNSIALADFDGRNRMDVICADGAGQGGAGHVYRLRAGKALWTADVGGGVVQGPAVGDVDGDKRLEILVCSRSKRLICLDENGKEKWSFPSETEVLTTPALGDIDGDAKTEIVFTSKDRRV